MHVSGKIFITTSRSSIFACPPSGERQEDIPLLVDHFLSRHNHRWRQQKQLSREAMHRIVAYSWPGNIRELENAIERSFILAKGSVVRAEDLPPELSAPASMPNSLQDSMKGSETPEPSSQPSVILPPGGMDLAQRLYELERTYFATAIRQANGNQAAAAKLLGIQPHTFRKRAKEKFGL